MKYTALGLITLTLLVTAGCGTTPKQMDPADRIAALVVAGRYEDAISEFLQLPGGTKDASYIRAANATSLACATLGALQEDEANRKVFFDQAERMLPDITHGRYRIPKGSDLRTEMETAQAIVRMTIKHLRARTPDKTP